MLLLLRLAVGIIGVAYIGSMPFIVILVVAVVVVVVVAIVFCFFSV